MASNINPTNIDGTYPIAGQDNDSQGFRDNFTNIKTNLQYAKTELEDLQNKVVLKSALTGTVLQNDMNNSVLYRPQLKAAAQSFKEFAGSQVGPVTISFIEASVQRINSINTTDAIVITLVDFPAAGIFGSLRLWVHVTFASDQTSAEVTFPNSVTLGTGNISNFNSNSKTITYTAAGDYMYELSTANGGNNFWIIQLA
jgi:hypothetical protein